MILSLTPPDDIIIETLDTIRNNDFNKDLDSSVITNNPITDQQTNHFFRENHLIRVNKTTSRNFVKNKKKIQNGEEAQPAPTNNKKHHPEKSKYI